MMCSQNIDDVRNRRRTKVPIFDLESGARNGFKELEVSEDCGVVGYFKYCTLLDKPASPHCSSPVLLLDGMLRKRNKGQSVKKESRLEPLM